MATGACGAVVGAGAAGAQAPRKIEHRSNKVTRPKSFFCIFASILSIVLEVRNGSRPACKGYQSELRGLAALDQTGWSMGTYCHAGQQCESGGSTKGNEIVVIMSLSY